MLHLDVSKALGHQQQTYLSRYCDETINNYREPERKGISKGDLIGPSFKQNAACVLVGVTNIPIKVLAERTGISYPSMRKWNSQACFRAAKDKRCEEFAAFVDKEFIESDDIFRDMLDRFLYSQCVEQRLPHVPIIGRGKIKVPKLEVRDHGCAVPAVDMILEEIDRSLHTISTGVISLREKQRLSNLLSKLKKYLKQ